MQIVTRRRTTSFLRHTRRGVWLPAFAGTTGVYAATRDAQKRKRNSREAERRIGRMQRSLSLAAARRAAHHALDLVGRVGLAADREQRRGGGQVDGVDDALNLGRDGEVVALGILAGRGQRVGAGRPLRAVRALAIPDEAGVALVQVEIAGIGGLAGRARDRDGGVGVRRRDQIPGRRFVEVGLAAVDSDRIADIDQRLGRLCALR